MPTQAEVDLLVNATRTLPDLERDLDRVLRAAQADMSDLDVSAVLDQTAALRQLDRDLDRVIASAQASADQVTLDAAVNQRAAIRAATRDLDRVVNAVNAGHTVDPLAVRAALNVPATLAAVRHDLNTVVRAAQASAPDIDVDVDLDTDRLAGRLRTLTSSVGRGAGALTSLGVSATTAGSAVGALPGLLVSVVGAAQQIAPAAAVATTGLLAVKLATGAVKLGMIGVGEAVQGAFDPDTKPEDLAKQMAKLAPEARKAVTEIVKLKPAFKAIQQNVQNKLFKDFDGIVKDLSTSVLPQLGKQLGVTATTLNKMGKGVGEAASQLGDSGVLGKALKSANKGLKNLTDIPGQAVTAFGELAAAAGPSFERITKAAAGVADKVSDRLTAAFKDGSLEKAIDNAVDAIAQLGRVAGNVFGIIGNLMKAATDDGGGLFKTLEDVTKALRDATASDEFQAALKQLVAVSRTLTATALPLFIDALGIVGEVIVAIGPSLRELIAALGDNLGRVLDELGPVLVSVAEAVAKLVPALIPFVDLAADLLVAILPALVPLFENLGRVFEAAAPFVAQLGESLATSLVPMLESLTPILEQVLPAFSEMAEELFPQLTDILVQLQPSLIELSQAFADLLVATAPLIVALIELDTKALAGLLEAFGPAIVTAVETFTGVLTTLSDFVSGVLFQSFQVIIDLVQGNFDQAMEDAGVAGENLRDILGDALESLTGISRTELTEFRNTVETKAGEAADSLRDAVSSGVSDAVDYLSDLPGKIQGAFGDLNNLLYSAGQDIINGLTAGIRSKVSDAVNAAQEAASSVKNSVKGLLGIHSPSTVMAELGVNTMEGFVNGIRSQIPDLETQVNAIFGALPNLSAQVTALDAPSVSVTPTVLVGVQIGNQVVDDYVTTRVETVNARDTRIRAQGVRR